MSERILLIGASSAIAQELARKLCQHYLKTDLNIIFRYINKQIV